MRQLSAVDHVPIRNAAGAGHRHLALVAAAPQTDLQPQEDGHWVLDPILLFNSYGHCNCGIISGVNNALWLNMGWKAHYVQLGDHTVCECSWDGGKTWHMFDTSMSFYCFNDQGEVASVREIEKNPRFYLENFAPGMRHQSGGRTG